MVGVAMATLGGSPAVGLMQEHPGGAEAIAEHGKAVGERCLLHLHEDLAAIGEQCFINPLRVFLSIDGDRQVGAPHRIGVRHGAQGIRRFCHTEAVTSPRLPTSKSEPVWFPYSARKRGFVRRIYRFLNARGLRTRLRG